MTLLLQLLRDLRVRAGEVDLLPPPPTADPADPDTAPQPPLPGEGDGQARACHKRVPDARRDLREPA